VGFIGAGNMCQALIEGWLQNGTVTAGEIFVSNRTEGKLKRVAEQFGVNACGTNEEVIDKSDVVLIAVKPQDFDAAIEPIASSFHEDQIVISLAAGVPLRKIKRLLPTLPHVVRVMSNTPARVGQGAFSYCVLKDNLRIDRWMERMFGALGLVVRLDEGDQFEAAMVATSAGIGFVYELMIYWQEWLEERGIDPGTARAMTAQTFMGASALALGSPTISIEELQAKVTSKKGVTAAGLASMRELELERLLRYSFEKCALRDRELAE
jgi:pyrroline-5-carboxylate reductase